MTCDAVRTPVLDLLQRQGRVSYRALKRRFDLDGDYLADLKAEIIKAQRLALAEGEVAYGGLLQERRRVLHALRLLGDITARCQPLERASAEAHCQRALLCYGDDVLAPTRGN